MTNDTKSLVVTESYGKSFTNAIVSLLSIVAVFGATGNILVVAVICRAKKLRSVMNRFVLHLAISDLIVCVFGIPLFLVINFEKSHFDLNAATLTMCKIGRFVQYLAPLASLTLLITIGKNRHQAIVRPLNIMTFGQANKLITAAWLFALILTGPSLYLTQLQEMIDAQTNTSYPYCATIPTDVLSGLVYTFALSMLGYVIPLVILIVLYTKIYLTVWKRPKTISGQTSSVLPATRLARTKKKVLKMLITVIFVFLATWLPLFIYVGIIQPLLRKAKPVDHVRLITYSLGLSQSSVNPVIYGFYNKNFREGCKEVFRISFRMVTLPAEMIRRSIKDKSTYSPKKEAHITKRQWRQSAAPRRDKYRRHSEEEKPAEKDNGSLIEQDDVFQLSLKRSGGMRLREALRKAKSNSEGHEPLQSPVSLCPDKRQLIACKSDCHAHTKSDEKPGTKRRNTVEYVTKIHQRKFNSVKSSLANIDGVIARSKEDNSHSVSKQVLVHNVDSHLYESGLSYQSTEGINGQNGTFKKESSKNFQSKVPRPRSIRFTDDFEDTKL